jgi:4-nitrophenyl phosphatase
MLKSFNPLPEGAILDMDGVLWRENQPLCDLPRLFDNFKLNKIKVAMASNSGTSSIDQFLDKFLSMGVVLETWQIISSAMAINFLLRQNYPSGGPIYIIGSSALIKSLKENGFIHSEVKPMAVVVGMDRELTYNKIDNASRWVRSGLPLFGTNPDLTYPTPDGFTPGAGTCIAAVEAASGIKAIIAGKPNPYLFEVAMQRLGTKPEKTLVIGDRLETDILGGFRAGCMTLLVLSGVAQEKDLQTWTPKPNLVLKNIMELFTL